MYCPNCNQEYDGKFCPECGTKLIEKPASQGGLSVNLGDGNAISGGIHHQDSHAVTNVDNSLHNITTNSSTVNNITNVASQKTEMEILQEKKTLYLNACKRAYEDNVLELAEVNALEEERLKLGLDKATANRILEQVRLMSERNARKSELNPIAKVKLRKLTENLQKNEVKALMQQIDSLEPLVNKYDHDELQRKYYLVLAALKSEKCIASYENTQTDNYWNTFWSYLAYIKDGNIVEAENLLGSLDRFTSYPEDNMTVLASAGELMKGNEIEAKLFLEEVKGEYTPALQRFVDSIYLLLEPETAKEMGADENTCAFYLVNFFGQKDPKVKAAEEKARREAEEKAKREAERKKKAEAEARRKAEEEERKKREAEEKARREAEEKAKREAEMKKKAEAEARRKAEEERKRREAEAERKRKEEEERKKANKIIIDRLVSNMVLVEGGTFLMGATPEQDECFKDEKPVHRVKLSPFRMSRYEVTLEQWAAVMDSYPTKHRDSLRPVTNISWNDCQEFITKLNAMTGMKFRLPTEAEWEYAARGGNRSKGFQYAGSNSLDEVAWIWKNSGDVPLDEYDKDVVKNNNCRTHDVGQKVPNELGLYDMCGNVYEWCADWYGEYEASYQENPQGPSSGKERVWRGGSYFNKGTGRLAIRGSDDINKKYNNVGFRLVSEPTPEDIRLTKANEAKKKAAIKTINGHDCVDLGLPSGTLWATCNIGASEPEEYGNYFAWGETSGYDEGKRCFDEEHYKFRVKKLGLFGSKWIYTKYCDNKNNGEVDNKLSLDKEDDAAYVQWGKGWRMPTTAQVEELINKDYTTSEMILQNGIRGLQITSKFNGNSIFLPAAGEFDYSFSHNVLVHKWELENHNNSRCGKLGSYWTRERLSGPYDDIANSFSFYISFFNNHELVFQVDNNEHIIKDGPEAQVRCFGYSIRPVRSKEQK